MPRIATPKPRSASCCLVTVGSLSNANLLSMDRAGFEEWCHEAGLAVTPDLFEAVLAFEEALYARNAVMNLTRVPREQCLLRHVVDSLLIAEFAPLESRVLDIGTGPGLPAWPLALFRPDLTVTAMDSSGKMLGFLREHPLPNLTVQQGRAEDVTEPNAYNLVTGRAFAPLPVQLEASAVWCQIGGRIVPFRTPQDVVPTPESLGLLGLRHITNESRSLPEGAGERLFPVFEKIRAGDPRYPRRWADMKKRPLT